MDPYAGPSRTSAPADGLDTPHRGAPRDEGNGDLWEAQPMDGPASVGGSAAWGSTSPPASREGLVALGVLLLFFGLLLSMVPFGLLLGIVLFVVGLIVMVLGARPPPEARSRRAPTGAGLAFSSFVLALLLLGLFSAYAHPCGVMAGAGGGGGYFPSVQTVGTNGLWRMDPGSRSFLLPSGSPLVLAPPSRVVTSAAFDSTDHTSVIFGGFGFGASSALGDTWQYQNASWRDELSRYAPVARFGAAFSDDPTDHGALLFGGATLGGSVFGDTWLYQHGNWSRAPTSNGVTPSPRVEAAMAYDPALGGVVLFGGFSEVAAGPTYGGALNDTWLYEGGQWHRLPTQGNPAPSVRGLASMTYVPAHGLVLVGGYSMAESSPGYLEGIGPREDVWSLTQRNWTLRAVSLGMGTPSWPEFVAPASDHGPWLLVSGSVVNELLLSGPANGWTWESYDPSAFGSGYMVEPESAAAVWFDNASSELLAFGGVAQQQQPVPTQVASAVSTPPSASEPMCIGVSFWFVALLFLFVPLTAVLAVKFVSYRRRVALSRPAMEVWKLAEDPESARLFAGSPPRSDLVGEGEGPTVPVEVQFQSLV